MRKLYVLPLLIAAAICCGQLSARAAAAQDSKAAAEPAVTITSLVAYEGSAGGPIAPFIDNLLTIPAGVGYWFRATLSRSPATCNGVWLLREGDALAGLKAAGLQSFRDRTVQFTAADIRPGTYAVYPCSKPDTAVAPPLQSRVVMVNATEWAAMQQQRQNTQAEQMTTQDRRRIARLESRVAGIERSNKKMGESVSRQATALDQFQTDTQSSLNKISESEKSNFGSVSQKLDAIQQQQANMQNDFSSRQDRLAADLDGVKQNVSALRGQVVSLQDRETVTQGQTALALQAIADMHARQRRPLWKHVVFFWRSDKSMYVVNGDAGKIQQALQPPAR